MAHEQILFESYLFGRRRIPNKSRNSEINTISRLITKLRFSKKEITFQVDCTFKNLKLFVTEKIFYIPQFHDLKFYSEQYKTKKIRIE